MHQDRLRDKKTQIACRYDMVMLGSRSRHNCDEQNYWLQDGGMHNVNCSETEVGETGRVETSG